MRKNSLGKVFRSKREWQIILDRHRASGLTQVEFCKKEGLSITSCHKWQQKLAIAGSFVELPPSQGNTTSTIELDLGDGRRFHFRV